MDSKTYRKIDDVTNLLMLMEVSPWFLPTSKVGLQWVKLEAGAKPKENAEVILCKNTMSCK